MKACPQCNIRYPADAVHCFLDGAELGSIRDPLIGATIAGRYTLEEVIGEGGMATVYRAHHQLVDRRCAIKIMSPAMAADATVRERFRREAKSTQMLGHPNVIEIFDQGETADGIPYMVMELLEGSMLASLVAAGAMPVPRALPIMIQIARGIARAHDLGVVHRDLKPENVFVCPRPDGTEIVKILDFGIALSKHDMRLTSTGELFGTPQYLAPERIVHGDTGPSVDLYAIGVMFFEIATGKLPFDAQDASAFLVMHLKERPPAPRTVEPSVPEALDALVVQLLEKDPKARPVDLHRVEHDLVALARSLGVAVPPDAESDPASSARPPARTLPSIAAEQWATRVALFEQMLSRATPAQGRDLRRTLDDLAGRVAQLTELRHAATQEQRQLEDVDSRGREGRQRFGFAVDALGVDASKARDDLRAARAEIERLGEASERAREGYLEGQRHVVTWEGRSGFREPYVQLAEAHRLCADALDAWSAARAAERAAHDAVEDKERAVADLDYQIAELRRALAHHEQGIDAEREATHQRLVDLNARVERIEAQLVHLATRFCEPLRARPELGGLFEQLEAATLGATQV